MGKKQAINEMKGTLLFLIQSLLRRLEPILRVNVYSSPFYLSPLADFVFNTIRSM